jgi:hypothetical protein
MMFKRKLKSTDILLIVANLVPVYGVWFEGWNARDAYIVYAMETFIVGAFTILKLLVATFAKKTDWWYNGDTRQKVSGLFFIFFFILHFGLFAVIQTTIFSNSANINHPGTGLFDFFLHWYTYINKDISIMLAGFIVSYFITNFLPFLAKEEYKNTPMMKLMFQPYGRIVIQQFTVILGSMFLIFGLGKIFILVFALARIWFEVYFNVDKIIDKASLDMEAESGKQ